MVAANELGKAGGWERMFGGDIDGGAGKTIWWAKLGCEEEGEEELCLASAAEENDVISWAD